MKLSGQSASPGYAHGPAFWVQGFKPSLTGARKASIDEELQAFQRARKTARADLENLQRNAAAESAEILEAHLMLLDDPEVIERTETAVRETPQTAAQAYAAVIAEFKAMFAGLADAYLRQRALDLADISDRVLFYIENPAQKYGQIHLEADSILLAEELTPSQMLTLDRRKVLGIVTSGGGSNSHTAILARSMEIPAVAGIGPSLTEIQSGQSIYLNAAKGELLLSDEESEIARLREEQTLFEQRAQALARLRGLPSETTDGTAVTLAANIAGPQDLPAVARHDAEAVGLYRTEFLYLDRSAPPSEDEQIAAYAQVFQGLAGKKVIVRTLDIGGDKALDYLSLKKEENPFLGVRGLRLCLRQPEIFRTQLRALLRAAPAQASWGLMFPMVSQVEEVRLALKFVEEVRAELAREGKAHSTKFDIGVMVEVPSMAWMIDLIAPYVDFISLGTNDLLQYSCAADRLNADVKSIYQPLNPGFLRQIHHLVKVARECDLHVAVCGSLSHHRLLMPYFIGCGVQELSMTAQHVLAARQQLRRLSLTDCRRSVEQVLTAATAEEVESRLAEFAI